MQVACIIDPPATLAAATDSTIALLRAVAAKGVGVHLVERTGVSFAKGELTFHATTAELSADDTNWYTPQTTTQRRATEFDLILIRLEPPVDAGYRYICQLLAQAQAAGVKVSNTPEAILDHDEKLAALRYPDLCPQTLVSSDRTTLLDFAAEQTDGCVLKPLGAMGGRGVFAFNHGDSNLAVAIDAALARQETLLIQERLAAIAEGDRRVFVIGGKAYPIMLNRVPPAGSHLANMVAGGMATATEIGEAEEKIVTVIGTELLEAGIDFAGLDVIGGKLTEINITCPTGLRTVAEQTAHIPAAEIIDYLLSQ